MEFQIDEMIFNEQNDDDDGGEEMRVNLWENWECQKETDEKKKKKKRKGRGNETLTRGMKKPQMEVIQSIVFQG